MKHKSRSPALNAFGFLSYAVLRELNPSLPKEPPPDLQRLVSERFAETPAASNREATIRSTELKSPC